MSMTTFSEDCDFTMEFQASFKGSLRKESVSSAVRSVPHQIQSKKLEGNKVILHSFVALSRTYSHCKLRL